MNVIILLFLFTVFFPILLNFILFNSSIKDNFDSFSFERSPFNFSISAFFSFNFPFKAFTWEVWLLEIKVDLFKILLLSLDMLFILLFNIVSFVFLFIFELKFEIFFVWVLYLIKDVFFFKFWWTSKVFILIGDLLKLKFWVFKLLLFNIFSIVFVWIFSMPFTIDESSLIILSKWFNLSIAKFCLSWII